MVEDKENIAFTHGGDETSDHPMTHMEGLTPIGLDGGKMGHLNAAPAENEATSLGPSGDDSGYKMDVVPPAPKPIVEEPAAKNMLEEQILGTLALDSWKEGDTEANEANVDLESIIGSGDNLQEMLTNYFTAFNEITRRSNEGPDKEMLDNVLAQWVPYFRNLPPEAFHGRTPGGQLPGMQLSSTTTTSSSTTTDTASSEMTSFFHSAYENLKRNFSGAPVAKSGEVKTSDKKEAPTPKKSDTQTTKEP
ncbi:unnamed protein product, partial [Mesorhabditis belari]|uniref:Uncharacterized protein n=1 Tax=Mesorhabditis belari TaxID=2138241 RepID=A0AAF3FIW5_9BILA